MKKIIILIPLFLFCLGLYGQNQGIKLHFVRPDNFAGKFMDLKIVLNKVEIGKISNKSHFVYKTQQAGTTKITLKAPGSPPKSITVNLEKNNKYYFLVGFNAMGKYIKQVNFADVKNDIPEQEDVIVEEPKNVIAKKDDKAPTIQITSPKVTRGFKIASDETEIKIIGTAIDESGIFKLTVNGSSTPVDENGKFQSMQALKPGENEIKIVATDTQENTGEFSFIINCKSGVVVDNPKIITKKDEKAPVISLSNPKTLKGAKISYDTDEIKIVGNAKDESGIFKLTVNGLNAPVDEKGDFQSLQALKPGANEIKIIATDTQDNTSEFSFIIDCKTKTVVSGEIVKPAEKRIALIIGNSDYKSAPLRNPVNDATLMTTELKKLGFDVNIVKNGSQNQMKQAISKFGELLAKDKNTVGLFYYAGHGIQIKGKNYLVPTDAAIEKEPDVEVYCVDLDGLLANLEYSGNNMNIIILDACRNNPFARSFRSQQNGGLATVNAPVGTIIAYATAPGSVAADGEGQNGLYTQEFVKALATPNLKIEDVFKKVRTQVKTLSDGQQIPWENSSIEGDFYFIKQK